MRSHARKGGNTQRGPRARGCVVIWGVGREPRQRKLGKEDRREQNRPCLHNFGAIGVRCPRTRAYYELFSDKAVNQSRATFCSIFQSHFPSRTVLLCTALAVSRN